MFWGVGSRDADRVVNFAAQNGAANAIYAVEEVSLGGALTNRIIGSLGRFFGNSTSVVGANTAGAIETAAVHGPKVFATFNGNIVEPVLTNQPLFHGVNMTWDELSIAGGLPAKGTNIDLLTHLNGGPNSAFRGTNLWADSPLANGNGPVSWAGEGGTVVKIDGSRVPSYDANSLTSGSVRKFDGSFADHAWTGEAEFPIHAFVPLDAITQYGVVVESRSGALRVLKWIDNPNYKK